MSDIKKLHLPPKHGNKFTLECPDCDGHIFLSVKFWHVPSKGKQQRLA